MDISDDDRELFRANQSKTRPIKPQNKHIHRKKPTPVRKPIDTEDETRFIVDTSIDVNKVSAEDPLYFHRGGLQQKILRDLRQGKLPIDAELDLHGYTLAQAEQQLLAFLSTAQQQRYRLVHIIHGKGHRGQAELPILKNMVHQYLQQIPLVLAYSSASRHQGGSGAVNVLLKTKGV